MEVAARVRVKGERTGERHLHDEKANGGDVRR
jgi:hypothetical protein